MAMIKCSECGGDVSSNAAMCPSCGSPISQKSVPIAGIVVAVIIIIVLFLVGFSIYSQKEKEQAKRNLDILLNPKSTYVEIAETKREDANEHYEFLRWGATNGFPEYQFAYATNLLSSHLPILTNAAVEWLHKAAEQDYQPAKDLLLKLE